MQRSNQPGKFVIPFAQNDPAKVEIPPTTPDPVRASQSLGFPPLTGMPPEAGGVPPQLEDMNGLLNIASRIPWWYMLGGNFAYDAAFATDSNINGYPIGAELLAASNLGFWMSTANDNVANPDTIGTGWVPGYHYGATALTGLTGGTVTLTPAQAAKRRITVAGTLTSNLIIVVPTWLYDWTVYNNTGGAFTVTVKTAAGTGPVIPQNGAPTPVAGDGTNITAVSPNVGVATSSTQPPQLGQMTGRLLRESRYYISGGVQTMIVDGGTPTTVGASTFNPLAATTKVHVEVVGGGGAGGGTAAQTAGSCGAGGGGAAGGYAASILTSGFSAVAITIGAGGAPVSAGNGSNGGQSSFGALVTAPGGNGGGVGGVATSASASAGGASSAGTGNFEASQGSPGQPGLVLATNGNLSSGTGGPSIYGGGGNPRVNQTGAGQSGGAPGAGGSGSGGLNSAAAQAGGIGGTGSVIVREYA